MMRPGKAKGPSMGSGSGSGGGTLVNPTAVPTWMEPITITHAQLQDAALTNDIELYSLLARGTIEGIIVRPTTAFAGTGITTYQISIGLVGSLEAYFPLLEVTAGVSAVNIGDTFDFKSFGAATSIRIAAVADADLDNSTDGEVDVYLKLARLPA